VPPGFARPFRRARHVRRLRRNDTFKHVHGRDRGPTSGFIGLGEAKDPGGRAIWANYASMVTLIREEMFAGLIGRESRDITGIWGETLYKRVPRPLRRNPRGRTFPHHGPPRARPLAAISGHRNIRALLGTCSGRFARFSRCWAGSLGGKVPRSASPPTRAAGWGAVGAIGKQDDPVRGARPPGRG